MCDIQTDNTPKISCLEWKDKYEKCMIDTQKHFNTCMHLLTESIWCAVETNAPNNKKNID